MTETDGKSASRDEKGPIASGMEAWWREYAKREDARKPGTGTFAVQHKQCWSEIADEYWPKACTNVVAGLDQCHAFCVIPSSREERQTQLVDALQARFPGALASGMQGFQISAAKHLNAAISQGKPGPRRRGVVFPDRYHAEIITSPRQARHTLSYIMNNWRKHQEDRKAPMSVWRIDWFSTAAMFPGWAEYGEEAFLWRGPVFYDPLVVYQPKTWLLREGWKKAGTISCREVPSAKR